MFNVWRFHSLEAVVSSGLGGGSLIYANVLLRKDPKWFVRDGFRDGVYEYWPVSYEKLSRTTKPSRRSWAPRPTRWPTSAFPGPLGRSMGSDPEVLKLAIPLSRWRRFSNSPTEFKRSARAFCGVLGTRACPSWRTFLGITRLDCPLPTYWAFGWRAAWSASGGAYPPA